MLPALEMRIREAEENLLQLRFLKHIRQELHRIPSQHRDIPVLPVATSLRALLAQRVDALRHILRYLQPDLEPEHERVRELRGELDDQPAEAAANVGDRDPFCGFGRGRRDVEGEVRAPVHF